jgi:hypothetical protein
MGLPSWSTRSKDHKGKSYMPHVATPYGRLAYPTSSLPRCIWAGPLSPPLGTKEDSSMMGPTWKKTKTYRLAMMPRRGDAKSSPKTETSSWPHYHRQRWGRNLRFVGAGGVSHATKLRITGGVPPMPEERGKGEFRGNGRPRGGRLVEAAQASWGG